MSDPDMIRNAVESLYYTPPEGVAGVLAMLVQHSCMLVAERRGLEGPQAMSEGARWSMQDEIGKAIRTATAAVFTAKGGELETIVKNLVEKCEAIMIDHARAGDPLAVTALERIATESNTNPANIEHEQAHAEIHHLKRALAQREQQIERLVETVEHFSSARIDLAQQVNALRGIRGALDDVGAFHRAIPEDIVQDRGMRPAALVRAVSRWRLLQEEVAELAEAALANDLVEVVDAYADIVYIVLGSAIMQFGADRFARVWNEVHRSNMAKAVDGVMAMREDGKIIKPEGWTPPDIAGALEDPKC